jgi:hypothetical protein
MKTDCLKSFLLLALAVFDWRDNLADISGERFEVRRRY